MSLTEKTIIDKIEIVETNSIQVRTATVIVKDGVEIAKTYHRHVINPTDDITNEDSKVQLIAKAIWTPEVISAYVELQKANQLKAMIPSK